MRRGEAALLLALGLALGPAVARAQQGAVDRALASIEQADFEGARAALREALADAALPPEEYARAIFLDGALDAAEGNEVEGRRHLEAALALNPDLEPPELFGAAVGDLVQTIREARGAERAALRLEMPSAARAGEDAEVVAEVVGAPPGLVDHLELGCEGDPTWTRRGETSATLTVSAPAGELVCHATAFAGSGQRVLSQEARLAVAAAAPTDAGEEEASGMPDWLLGVAIGGGAALAILVAVIAGVAAGSGGGDQGPAVVGVQWNLTW